MSGITQRLTPPNSMDPGILYSSVRDSIESVVGLTTVPLDEASEIVKQVLEDIKHDARKYPTFDEYWCDK
jgi:hypothetical protein